MTSIEVKLRTFAYVLVEAVLREIITVGINDFGDRISKDDFFLFWGEEGWGHGGWDVDYASNGWRDKVLATHLVACWNSRCSFSCESTSTRSLKQVGCEKNELRSGAPPL
jgi:hypothetical protein